MPRPIRPWDRLRLSRPLAAVLLVVLLAMLSVLQLANAAAADADLPRHHIPNGLPFEPIGK